MARESLLQGIRLMLVVRVLLSILLLVYVLQMIVVGKELPLEIEFTSLMAHLLVGTFMVRMVLAWFQVIW